MEPKFVPSILAKSNLNILNYQESKIWDYGGSQSKFFQYLASGKPIVSNINMGHCMITKHNLGIAKKFRSSDEYADAILSISKLSKRDYNVLCTNAQNLAKNFDYKILSAKVESLF